MSTITKEWLQQKIADMEAARDEIPFGLDEDDSNTLAAMKLALASLEAGPVGYIDAEYADLIKSGNIESCSVYAESGEGCCPAYTAPPAPVSVPDGVLKNLLPDAEKPEFWFEHNGTIFFEGVKFNNAVFDACRAAMLQGAENAESRCTIQTAPVLDSLLKKAESRCSNSPMALDGWVACSERMPSAGEKVLAYRPDAPESNDPLIKMATYVGGSAHGHGFDCYCKPTHWMPLPAAPQQEVKP